MEKVYFHSGICLLAMLLAGADARSQAPPVTSGLRLHLRADAGITISGSGISGWNDQSGNAFHTAQAIGGFRPALAYSAVNGLPAVTFDGSNDFLESTATVDLLGSQTSYTFIGVVKPGFSQKIYAEIFDYSHSSGNRFEIQQDGTSTNLYYNNAHANQSVNQFLTPTGFSIYASSFTSTGGALASRLNGCSLLTGTTDAVTFNTPAYFRVGNWVTGGREFNGQIAEVLVYNRVLTATELNQIDAFLATKYALMTCNQPLPVELSTFKADAAKPTAVRLAWTTASEKNSARYEVERSTNGKVFEKIGSLAAAGSSNALRSYTFADEHLPAGHSQLYYRLHMVDLDGTASYSPARVVALPGLAPVWTLSPNPARTAATLLGAAPGTTVQVIDGLGRTVATALADAAGTAALRLPAGLAAGMYVVRTSTQAQRLAVE